MALGGGSWLVHFTKTKMRSDSHRLNLDFFTHLSLAQHTSGHRLSSDLTLVCTLSILLPPFRKHRDLNRLGLLGSQGFVLWRDG
jgi:hypothetical protein